MTPDLSKMKEAALGATPEKFNIYTDQDEALEVSMAHEVRAFEERVFQRITALKAQLEIARGALEIEFRVSDSRDGILGLAMDSPRTERLRKALSALSDESGATV